jgi:hypothetical protein
MRTFEVYLKLRNVLKEVGGYQFQEFTDPLFPQELDDALAEIEAVEGLKVTLIDANPSMSELQQAFELLLENPVKSRENLTDYLNVIIEDSMPLETAREIYDLNSDELACYYLLKPLQNFMRAVNLPVTSDHETALLNHRVRDTLRDALHTATPIASKLPQDVALQTLTALFNCSDDGELQRLLGTMNSMDLLNLLNGPEQFWEKILKNRHTFSLYCVIREMMTKFNDLKLIKYMLTFVLEHPQGCSVTPWHDTTDHLAALFSRMAALEDETIQPVLNAWLFLLVFLPEQKWKTVLYLMDLVFLHQEAGILSTVTLPCLNSMGRWQFDDVSHMEPVLTMILEDQETPLATTRILYIMIQTRVIGELLSDPQWIKDHPDKNVMCLEWVEFYRSIDEYKSIPVSFLAQLFLMTLQSNPNTKSRDLLDFSTAIYPFLTNPSTLQQFGTSIHILTRLSMYNSNSSTNHILSKGKMELPLSEGHRAYCSMLMYTDRFFPLPLLDTASDPQSRSPGVGI